MKKTIKIKRKYEYKNLFSKGEFFSSEYMYMYVLENKKNYNRLAVAVTKKQGKSVARNRFKRLVKENYKNFEDDLRLGYDILFIINKTKYGVGKKLNFYDIKDSMESLFRKSRLLYEENTN